MKKKCEEYGLMRRDAMYLVDMCLRTWRHIPEDYYIYIHSCNNLSVIRCVF